ncbi:glutaminyl-peptide cyclotransferase [Riemerella columbina]|uniref:glutaminyl-peptide cyclotransferase n=1 Tax=Riemerella columbina TaxID=103810 RepID=UPI00267059EC|nr:glutaminyl-peptide cyclotransferase [Riemerella columbina]WKS94724.1 glutaminyl-peptide cyclotransferase [Riemerella columbina]
MQKKIMTAILALVLLGACHQDKDLLNALNDYNIFMESSGYHFGDAIKLPEEVTKNAEQVRISFGDQETSDLTINPQYFTLGDNNVTFIIKTKGGEALTQDATINVYAKQPEKDLNYTIVAEYPHDANNFVQGFQLEGNTIYESDGQNGHSRMIKYPLGTTKATVAVAQPDEVFSEGATIVGDKIYQLTWQNKKGFIYDKNSLKLLEEFPYPGIIGEGWGITYDGQNLIVSDGSKNLYFLNPKNPSEVVRFVAVAGHDQAYDRLNELEYHQGFIYANVWQKPIILKINPKNGEVVAKFDFSELAKKHTTGEDDVLNGIAFKGDHMLVTGKNWDKIYEVEIK